MGLLYQSKDNIYEKYPFGIQTFGHFRLYESGRIISPSVWKTKKARSLFIFLTLHGYDGVNGSKVSLKFWPDSDSNSSKNNRYVTLSQIRSSLGEWSHIASNDNGNITILPCDNTFSDCHYMWNTLENISQKSVEVKEYVLKLYGSGELCSDLEEPWIDGLRDEYRKAAKLIASNLVEHYQKIRNGKNLHK